MKLTVFGASGRVGVEVVRQALDAGHRVAAVIRDRAALDVTHPALDVVRVPGLTDPDALLPALAGSDAVLSGIGPRGRRDGPIAGPATQEILDAMKATGVRRLVAVSAMPLGPIPPDDSWLNRRVAVPLLRRFLRAVYADLAVMEDEIRRDAPEWTVVRPPRLVDKPVTGVYRIAIGANVSRGTTISRADTAHAMLALLDNPAAAGQPVGVAY